MASFPARETALGATVRSVIDQVGALHVYLNGYSHVPACLAHPRVAVYRSQEAAGDILDTGKFWASDKATEYFITLDDDLIYPPDYVSVLVSGIERYGRQRICTFHGRSFAKFPIHSYYRAPLHRLVRCLGGLEEDRSVQFGGTGVMGMHVSTLRPRLQDFGAHGMTDVWMGIAAATHRIPIMALAHRAGWITEAPEPATQSSIYVRNKHHDTVQTATVNAHAALFSPRAQGST